MIICKDNAIDTHAHLWPEGYLQQSESLGAKGLTIASGMGAGITREKLSI